MPDLPPLGTCLDRHLYSHLLYWQMLHYCSFRPLVLFTFSKLGTNTEVLPKLLKTQIQYPFECTDIDSLLHHWQHQTQLPHWRSHGEIVWQTWPSSLQIRVICFFIQRYHVCGKLKHAAQLHCMNIFIPMSGCSSDIIMDQFQLHGLDYIAPRNKCLELPKILTTKHSKITVVPKAIARLVCK